MLFNDGIQQKATAIIWNSGWVWCEGWTIFVRHKIERIYFKRKQMMRESIVPRWIDACTLNGSCLLKTIADDGLSFIVDSLFFLRRNGLAFIGFIFLIGLFGNQFSFDCVFIASTVARKPPSRTMSSPIARGPNRGGAKILHIRMYSLNRFPSRACRP